VLRLIHALVLASLAAAAALGPSAHADHLLPQYEDPLDRVSRHKHIIKTQLQLGLAYEQRALEALLVAQDPESLADASSAMQQGYVKLRFAVSGVRMKLSLARAFQDPLLKLSAERIDDAMFRIRVAKLATEAAAAGSVDQVPKAIENLEAAIAITQLVNDLI
jgi:hypothetical protein